MKLRCVRVQQHPTLLTKDHLSFAPAHCTEGKKGKPMTYGAMYANMKKLLPLCGMTKEEAGCHSFRRGTATGLAHINAPSHVTKGIGTWGSDAYLSYIDATESGAMETAMLAMAEADPTGILGTRGVAR